VIQTDRLFQRVVHELATQTLALQHRLHRQRPEHDRIMARLSDLQPPEADDRHQPLLRLVVCRRQPQTEAEARHCRFAFAETVRGLGAPADAEGAIEQAFGRGHKGGVVKMEWLDDGGIERHRAKSFRQI
jgi:hypothetical protein